MSGEGAWTNQIVNQLIIVGTGGELLVYSPTQAAGNLISSVAGAATTDQFGNNILQGVASYASSFAVAMTNGAVAFYTGSLLGGWTLGGQVATDASGDLFLLARSGRAVTTNNNTLDNGAGGMSVTSLTVNGSSNTGTGLPAGVPTGGPNGGVFAGHTHDFDGHTHAL